MARHSIDIHKALIDRCRNGERKAQYELYRLYSGAMYNVSLRIVNHVGEAEDILQESFLHAFRKLHELRADVTFGTWLKKIVVNRSITALSKRRLKLVEDIPDTETVPPATADDEDYMLEVKRVHEAIHQLPDGYRIVLSLYLLEGYDHAEIAQVLNITESTSKSQYNRAKERLRNILTRRNYVGQD